MIDNKVNLIFKSFTSFVSINDFIEYNKLTCLGRQCFPNKIKISLQ